MKIKFTDKFAAREGREADVTDAAARRLIESGAAEKVGAKSEAKAEPKTETKKPAKKTAAKKS